MCSVSREEREEREREREREGERERERERGERLKKNRLGVRGAGRASLFVS
jgi:hypothetical protein